MKPQKEKPVYNVLQNISFLLGQIRLGHPSLLVFLALELVFSVVSPVFGIYLPKIAVDLAQSQAGLEQILVSLGGFGLLTALCMGISSSVARGQYMLYNDMRAYFQLRLLYQSLSCDYRVIESEAGQTKYQRAWNSVYFGDFSGTSVMLVACRDIAVNILCFLLYSGILASFSPLLILLLTGLSLLSLLAMRRAQVYENSRRNDQAQVERKLRYVVNTGGSVPFGKDIRLYGMGSWFRSLRDRLIGQSSALIGKIQNRYFGAGAVNAAVLLVRDGLVYGLLIGAVTGGRIGVSDFVLYFGAVTSFSGFVTSVVNSFGQLNGANLQMNDLRAFFDQTDEPEPEHPAVLSDLHGSSIEFRDVSFSYEGGKRVLDHFNLTIRPGEKIALVGVNGAGKTTLVKLLCGFYRPDSGEIRVGGVRLDRLRKQDRFRLFSAVFQDVFLPPFSVAETISLQPAGRTDRARVESCLKKVGLWEKIASLPYGIDTPMTRETEEQGVVLSGGQRQKLLMARALYRDAPVYILDEPTAALDPIAESETYEQFRTMADGKTVLYISHRLASTRFCDRIVLLENGRAAEEGTHDTLLRSGGRYAELYEMQSRYYREKGAAENEGA